MAPIKTTRKNAPKETKGKKVDDKKVEAKPEVEPVVEQVEANEVPQAPEQPELSFESILADFAKAKELNIQANRIIVVAMNNLKKMSKKVNIKKKREKNPNSAPSGFARPGPISSELSKFLGKKEGEEVARTFVTRYMSVYIKDNELQNPERKREIRLDDKLAKLFGKKTGSTIEYFEIQRLLKGHYIKATPVAA